MSPLLWSMWALAQEPSAPVVAAEAPSAEELRSLREALTAQQAQLDAQRAEIEALKAGSQSSPAPVPSKTAFGDAVWVAPGEDVQDVTAYGQDVRVAGRVRGDAASFGGDVQVLSTGVVDGDATSFGGRVQVEPGGVVRGDRVAFSDEDDVTSAVTGAGGGDSESWLGSLRRRAVRVLSFAGLSVLIVGLVPQRIGRVARFIDEHPVRALLTGLIGGGGMVLAALLFAVTVIGLPFTLLLGASLGLAGLLGFVGLCQSLGDRLPMSERLHGRWWVLAAGCVLWAMIDALPWAGVLILVLGGLVGLGAALRTRLGGA